jgi:hypothetical protein
MNLPTTRRALPAILLCAALLAAVLAGSLTGCSSADLGKPLLTLDGEEISENMVQLLMARVKGNLASNGYSVSSDSFWDQVVSLDGTRYDEYTKQLVLRTAKEYLAGVVLFAEKGLSLSQATLDSIDQEIQDMQDGAGSATALNQTLSSYGANTDILRALYIIEAKNTALKTSLYGTDGSLLSDSVKQEYLEENAIAFRQLLIRSYRYLYVTDTNGDDVYYLADENNAKVSNIAYDTVNGHKRTDKDGKVITDSNGSEVYYTDDGRIAYDRENGVRSYDYDEDGNPKTEQYSDEELEAHREAALELLAKAQTGGISGFEELLAEYEESGDDAYLVSDSLCFLYKTDNSLEEFNDIADALQWREDDDGNQVEINVGEAVALESDNGIHVMMRYNVPSDAATNSSYEDWFSGLSDRIIETLFADLCAPYMERVTVDEELFAALPSMKEVGTNYKY